MRRLSVLALLCGALIAVAAAGRTWLVIATTDPVLGEISIDASGRDLSPAITGALVLAAAATLVALLTRGWPRRVATMVLFVDGLWASWLALSIGLRPNAAAASASRSGGAVPGGLGPSAATVSGVEVSVWPWVFVVAAVLIAGGAAASIWAGLRPEPVQAPPVGVDTHGDNGTNLPATERRRRENARAWDDLSDGKDLTP